MDQIRSLTQDLWKIFEDLPPGKTLRLVFITVPPCGDIRGDEGLTFFPFLCGKDQTAGYEINAFMDVAFGQNNGYYDIYIRCVNFMTFFAAVIRGITGNLLVFSCALDEQGEHLKAIECDIDPNMHGNDPAVWEVDEALELPRLHQLVYEIRFAV